MIIKKVEIERKTKFKIYNKHGIKFNEVEQALNSKNKFVKKTKDEKYVAFTKTSRHLTIVFSITKGIATIITAYPSSRWQIDLLKRRTQK